MLTLQADQEAQPQSNGKLCEWRGRIQKFSVRKLLAFRSRREGLVTENIKSCWNPVDSARVCCCGRRSVTQALKFARLSTGAVTRRPPRGRLQRNPWPLYV